MTDLEQVFRTIDELTPEEKQQVMAYIQSEPAEIEPPKQHVFDLHAGMIWISDDFDDELPDSFWLGEK